MDNNTVNSANQTDVLPDSSTEGNVGQQNASPAEPKDNNSNKGVNQVVQQSQENVPFDKHPRWRELQKTLRSERQEREALKRQLIEQQGYLNALKNQGQNNQPQLAPEQKAQLEQLLELMTPHLKERLGLSKIEQLEKNYNELSNSWQSNQAESELEKEISSFKSLGFNEDEVRAELEDAIEQSDLNYKPGIIKMLARNLFWDRRGELAERAVNKETIEKRDALKRGQIQNPASGTPGKTKAKTGQESFSQFIKDNGGLENLDWTR